MLKLLTASACAVALTALAQAQDTSRDAQLVTSIDQQDINYVVESLGHRIDTGLTDEVGVVATSVDSVQGDLTYGVQGKVCNDETGCLGFDIYVLFDGSFTSEDANEINQRYSAIKATQAEGDLLLSRYLILDSGQTLGNLKTNVENTLAISRLFRETAKQEAATEGAVESTPAVQVEPDPSVDASLIDFGDDSGEFANDGGCDDARFSDEGDDWDYQRQHVMKDASDCRTMFETGVVKLVLDFGENSGEYADDATCDDVRFEGDGRSILETDSHIKKDAADCIAAYQAGTISQKTSS